MSINPANNNNLFVRELHLYIKGIVPFTNMALDSSFKLAILV